MLQRTWHTNVFGFMLLLLSFSGAKQIPGEGEADPGHMKVGFLSRGQTLRMVERQHWAELRDMLSRTSLDEIEHFSALPADAGLGLALLTSLFIPDFTASLHTIELFTSLLINIFNPHIGQVHVLLESVTDECEWFPELLTKFLPAAPWTNETLAKIVCVPVDSQPTYADLFRYANSKLAERLVLLANTDVAFDQSLGLIIPEAFTSGHHGLVLSVHAPPYGEKYKEVVGSDCAAEPRCVVGRVGSPSGWGATATGTSWDAYLFRAPFLVVAGNGSGLGALNLSHVESEMNRIGAENNAAFELEVSLGLNLTNPCLHVKASHYHCIGGKMHRGGRREHVDGGERRSLGGVIPCWDCPGVRRPPGAAASERLCAAGSTLPLSPERLGRDFPQAGAQTFMCCGAADGCEDNLMARAWAGSLQLCRAEGDTDCIISHGEDLAHRIY